MSVGVGLATVAIAVVSGEGHLVLASLLPFAIGVSLLLSAERRFRARFTQTAFDIAGRAALTIPYSSLLEVRPLTPFDKPRPRAFRLQVVHTGGTIVVPCPLNVASERIYAFLRSQIPSSRDRGLPPSLESYCLEQEKAFGPSKVFSSGGRHGPRRVRSALVRPVGFGLLLTGLAWAVAPRAPTGWAVAGVVTLLLGALLVVVDLLQRKQEGRVVARGFRGSALVVSPLGIALEQGPLRGHVTWQEIRKVTVQKTASAFQGRDNQGPCLVLQVEGAAIPLTDSYDQPLAEIHQRILQYWR